MCDEHPGKARTGWQGWPRTKAARVPVNGGRWVDLTHPFSSEVPRAHMFQQPRITYFAKMPEKPLNISYLETVVHIGTHLDAPRHFYADGPGMDAIPLERLMGEGVVLALDKEPCEAIEPFDFENADPAIEAGDIIAVHTGWSERWGTPDWGRQPYISEAAADWLISKSIKILAVDAATPELPADVRTPEFDFPIHCALLGAGVLIAEQVANLDQLRGQRVEFQFLALPIKDCDGAPARVLGRPISF